MGFAQHECLQRQAASMACIALEGSFGLPCNAGESRR
jgi:hypothetical protein